MLQRLERKKYVIYEKYQGAVLSKKGRERALRIIRNHRLWESFLHEKLHFNWKEIHEIAEKMEHIDSSKLTRRLADYLGNPTTDPHGDPIPSEAGEIPFVERVSLSSRAVGSKSKLVSVSDGSPELFAYMEQLQLAIGSKLEILSRETFDNSFMARLNGQSEHRLSEKVGDNLFVVSDTSASAEETTEP